MNPKSRAMSSVRARSERNAARVSLKKHLVEEDSEPLGLTLGGLKKRKKVVLHGDDGKDRQVEAHKKPECSGEEIGTDPWCTYEESAEGIRSISRTL